MVGIRHADVDFVSCYDAFTFTTLIQLEANGFCGPGEAGDFVKGGRLQIDHELPSNLSGGHLSEGYTHGVQMVIDADALNLLAARNQPLPPDCILTPHPGEAARLLGSTAQDIQNDRFGAAHSLAEKFKAVVVLKGAGTIVAAPDHRPAVIGAGNPGMAVGGMGDVLTGVIAGIAAQCRELPLAARAGVYVHALAGDLAARRGERGMTAGDVVAELRACVNPR